MTPAINGGLDRGAHHHGIVEADFNWELANRLHNWVNLVGGCFKPVVLRGRDEEISLIDRGQHSYELGCDLVISLHVNAAEDPSLHGALCFHWPTNRVGESVGDAIARCWPKPLHNPYKSSIAAIYEDSQTKKWLQRPRNVLQFHRCTAVLVEVGYCSNVYDAQALKSSATRTAMLPALLAGLCRYRQIVK